MKKIKSGLVVAFTMIMLFPALALADHWNISQWLGKQPDNIGTLTRLTGEGPYESGNFSGVLYGPKGALTVTATAIFNGTTEVTIYETVSGYMNLSCRISAGVNGTVITGNAICGASGTPWQAHIIV
ncbi:MAG: hypothetical protein JSS53_00200 [Proteobacteria bacterium]|nr:hypothetical protein [Pseudomonadota bacterium]